MIRHIVLFKLKHGCTFFDEAVLRAEESSVEVGERVPGIVEWRVGRNISSRDDAYDFAVVALLLNERALKDYLDHPFHRQSADQWRQIGSWVVTDLHEESSLRRH